MSDPLHPCNGHNCDWCRICRRGDCCGQDKVPDGAPAIPAKAPA